MFLLVVGNGWRYIPQYTKKVSSAYMLSRTSMLYVVFAQYIIWNYANLPSAIHLVRVYYSNGWSNLRFIKNVVMSSYLLMICLYRMAFEQQVRVRCLVTAPLGIALYFLISISTANGNLAAELTETIPNFRLTSTLQESRCFFASVCYIYNAVPLLMLKMYGPVAAITIGLCMVDTVFNSLFSKAKGENDKNNKKYAPKREMTCFEAHCMQRYLHSYFGQEGDYYLSPEETGEDNWCVKEEYMILSGFCLGHNSHFIVRNRDLIVLWISELLPPRLIRLLQINLSLTYWPVENGHVQFAHHYVIDGPLGSLKKRAKAIAADAKSPVNADEKQKH